MTEHNSENRLKFNRKNFIGIAIAALLIAVAVGGSKLNSATQSKPESKPPVPKEIFVQTTKVFPESHAPVLKSTATVQAWQESQLAAQVSGRVVSICDCLETGNTVAAGTVLAKIEAADYQVAVAQAKQALAEAKQKIAEEEARSEQAKVDWEELNLGEPTNLALRKPQLDAANATLERRKVELQQANRNLKRTQIKAPYTGIITARNANLGNFIGMGSSIGTILNKEKVQINFALTQEDVNKIDSDNKTITIMQSGNTNLTWPATIERVDSVIDPKTRLVNVIAEVQNPFNTETHASALRVGTFVTTEFMGKTMDSLYALPASAVLADKSVYIVNAENTVDILQAQIAHRNPSSVLVYLPSADKQFINVISQGQSALVAGLKVTQQGSTEGE